MTNQSKPTDSKAATSKADALKRMQEIYNKCVSNNDFAGASAAAAQIRAIAAAN